jgi:CHAT domain-containing protein/tetratricopeptide (TPR) repeat protein
VTPRRGLLSVTIALATSFAGGHACDSSSRADEQPQSSPFDSLHALGADIYAEGRHTDAEAVFGHMLEHARSVEDVRAEAEALTWMGLAGYRLGNHAEAEKRLTAAVDLEERHGLADLMPWTLNALGLVAWDQSRLAEAEEWWARTIEAAGMVDDVEYVAKASANRGLIAAAFGEFDEARTAFLDGVRTGRQLGILPIELRSLVNLAMVEVRSGKPRDALRWLEEARQLPLSEDPVGEENWWGQLVSAHIVLGEPGPALAALDTALTLARAQGNRQAEAANLELMADAYRQAGDLRRALELYQQAIAINAQIGLLDEHAAELQKVAEIHTYLGNYATALEHAADAVQMHESVESWFAALTDHVLLAELGALTEDDSLIRRHVQRARALAERLDIPGSRVDVALTEARIAELRGEPRRVLDALDAVAADMAYAGYEIEAEAGALRTHALAELGDLARAEEAAWGAVAAADRVRRAMLSGALRTKYLSVRSRPYAELIAVLLERGRVEHAFEVADAARVRLATRSSSDTAKAVGRAEQLLDQIDALVVAIAENEGYEDAVAVRELSERLEDHRSEYERLTIQTGERLGRATARGRSDVAADAVRDAVRDALRADEVLVEYFLTAERLVAFRVTRDGIHAAYVPVSAEQLADRVRLARELLADRQTSPELARQVLGTLHRDLLGSADVIAPDVDIRRVFVVPHGALTYLPFAALREPATGRYLVEDVAVASLPSARALVALRSRKPEAIPALAVAAFAPEPVGLPASGIEVEAVRTTLDGMAYLGAKATEGRLRRALEHDPIVHVAAHGVMNARSPFFSRIELARANGALHDDDGRLELHELPEISVASQLVFLSGCETGVGAAWATVFDQGEDYATLDRAFLAAGARNVVATLWPVEDEGAAEFARRFYAALSTFEPAEALARAQRDILAGGRWNHPYYWAGYRLAGSGDLRASAQMVAGMSVQR